MLDFSYRGARTAALLATELLGGMSVLATILRLGSTLTLVGEVLDYIKIDCMIVRFNTEYLLVKNNLLSGF